MGFKAALLGGGIPTLDAFVGLFSAVVHHVDCKIAETLWRVIALVALLIFVGFSFCFSLRFVIHDNPDISFNWCFCSQFFQTLTKNYALCVIQNFHYLSSFCQIGNFEHSIMKSESEVSFGN